MGLRYILYALEFKGIYFGLRYAQKLQPRDGNEYEFRYTDQDLVCVH